MAGKKSGTSSKKAQEAKLKSALRRFVRTRGEEYLQDPNINSIGIGRKNGKGEISIVFTVDEKAASSVLEALGTRELPESIEIEGVTVPTDIIQRNYEASFELVEAEAVGDRKIRQDPMMPGISVGNVGISAGTFGAVVFDAETGAPCILSNWHVLHGNSGLVGDQIVQPGPHDDNDVTANGCGTLMRSHLGAAGDCAIARIDSRSFKRDVLDLDVVPRRMANVELDDKLVKSGRTTGVTYGIVRRTDVMAKINYNAPAGEVAIGGFEIGVDPRRRPENGEISMGGDSGALWMIADGAKATDIFAGRHFAGESSANPDEHALACYPRSVQKKLGFVLEPPEGTVLKEDEPEGFGYRAGFDSNFLGIKVPIPHMSTSIKRDAVNFGRANLIPYTHFSVCLSAKRRMARFVAWNIDGARKVVLKSHRFRQDPRLGRKVQFSNSLYANNKLDRGHIARRADLAWGRVPEAKQANRDSYYYTNIAPQHERYNQSKRGGIWGRLENIILQQAAAQDIRVSVLAGPVFRDDDPEYRGARIPQEYWKLVAYRGAGGKLTSSSFVLSQVDLLSDIETIAFDPFKLFQVSVEELSERTGLGFGAYAASDVLSNPERITLSPELAAQAEDAGRHIREIADESALLL